MKREELPKPYIKRLVHMMKKQELILEEEEQNLENYLWNTGFQGVF